MAGRVRRLIDGGTAAAEIAILFRVNAQSEAYEQALSSAGIPYVVRGGARFFDRPEIRAARAALRKAAGAGTDDEDLPAAVRRVLTSAGWAPAPPPGGGAARDTWEALAALVTLADDLAAAAPGLGYPAYLAELDDRAAHQHAPTVDGVTLASLHSAKGLEWDAVFLVGLADGTVPIQHAVTPEQISEERRLLYVGVTRARENLCLTWAQARATGGRKSRRPSRFLLDQPEIQALTGAAAARTGGPKGQPRGTAVCRVCGKPVFNAAERKLRRCATCPSSMDEGLFEQLRQWRLARATEQKQPAFCVFTDATLTAIAEAKPATVAELVAIPGVGAAKLAKYGDDVLEITGR
ncbi:MAG: ATP-dependent helicase UvrD/PcrA [Frankiaceae bacterium]|nr:ATP-dependent helicase UvrD/PcrA [Frankiaceae bacterium]